MLIMDFNNWKYGGYLIFFCHSNDGKIATFSFFILLMLLRG